MRYSLFGIVLFSQAPAYVQTLLTRDTVRDTYTFHTIIIMSGPYHLIGKSCFHRRIDLDTAYGPLNITFADIGCEKGPALLFMPGMFASRYLGIPLHAIAERAGVRLLVVDRPGMGASTDVPLAQRVAAWTDMLPYFLAYLRIPRVSLVAHSAGTIYLLNTWAQCRDYINPVMAVIGIGSDP